MESELAFTKRKMGASRRATYGCCGAPALPPFQHKCNNERVPATDAGSAGRSCGDRTGGVRTPKAGGSTPPTRTSRAGKAAEDALVAALRADGQEVVTFPEWMRRAFDGHYLGWVEQFPVGIMLAPARRFRADLFRPASRLVVEVEGQVHSIKARRKADILREQLLTAAGLRVVRLLPSQAIDGSAVELVSAALRQRSGDA